MCLYPTLRRNRKYISNKKNKGIVPEMKDERVQWVPTGCQKCMECRKQKALGWSVRLQEEIRTDRTGKFVTMTLSNEAYTELMQAVKEKMEISGYELDNEIATMAVRRFLERWRKKYKVSVKHWLITELGQGTNAKWQSTENLHLHGIIFTNEKEDIKTIWKYGYVFIGDYVTERTVNYCVKYMTKQDELHKEYTPIILTSPGIGRAYTQRTDARLNQYNGAQTDETYTTREGAKINLPVYWRNKIYSEEEREQLWLKKLDKQIRWVDKQKVSIAKDQKTYESLLEIARAKNKRLGYGDGTKNEDRREYELIRREIMQKKRTEKVMNGIANTTEHSTFT